MYLSEAFAILSLTPDAGKPEVERAYRMKAQSHHPDRIAQSGDEGEQAVRLERATEEMKTNNAKDTLLQALDSQPGNGAMPTEQCQAHSQGMHGEYTDAAPNQEEHREILQDLSHVPAVFLRIGDRIEDLSASPLCVPLRRHILATADMAGDTSEDVLNIIHDTWPWLGPVEWDKLRQFRDSAKSTIIKCDLLLHGWRPRKEHDGFMELYRALKEFPIAERKKGDPSWQALDRALCIRLSIVTSQEIEWAYNLL